MSPRPAIFISSVSKELRSARQLVSNNLTFLGYQPEWQDIFSSEEGDLREMLRRRIDACKGVVQLVGQCYGAEPPTPDAQFGRVSYTQYEVLYARQQKKKIWHLILDDDFPTDPCEPESQELHDLQNAYRERLKSENLLYHPLGNRDALEANVLKLRDELTRLRRGVKRWAGAVGVMLVLSVGVGIWILQRQQNTTRQLTAQTQELTDIKKLLEGTLQFSEVQSKVRQDQSANSDPAELQRRTYETLAKQLGIDAKVLAKKLPQFAVQLRKNPKSSAYERASAAFVAKDYNEAERLAVTAAEDAKKVSKIPEAIKAWELAGNSADARIDYAGALEHFRAGAQLTDRTRHPLEWARQQWKIARVLQEQGKIGDAEAAYQDVLSEYQRVRGDEDKDVLSLRNNLANALSKQGKYAEAEEQHRELARLREKVLGPEHPDTLRSRGNLAVALRGQGKNAEAETLHREVLKLREKILGPEHPDTLATRNNLANALQSQGKHAEAETEHREVLRLREKVLGPEHPDTLESCLNLALCLKAEKKKDDAKIFAQRAADGSLKVLGADHPDTLKRQKLWRELQN